MTSLICADDFGLSKSANRAIKSLLSKNMLQRVSLMANGDQFKQASTIYKQHPTAELGLHWNLTEGKPVANLSTVPSLVSSSRQFYSLGTFIIRTLFGKINLNEVRTELEAQYAKVTNQNLHITHINSHQNFHAFPPFNHICVDFAKAHKIKYVRDTHSIKNRLQFLPIRLTVFNTLMMLMTKKFGKTASIPSKPEILIHPGTPYDPPAIKKIYST
jgi:predicted glycoside hydrolase/deacetylase ChbG (UPF0249 family)